MTRSVIRLVQWTCSHEQDSPTPIYAWVCTTPACPEPCGPSADDFEEARDWAFRHVGRHPSHTGFREEITRYWRMHGEGIAQANVDDTSRLPVPRPSTPTYQYGAPALPVILGPVDAGTAPTER